MMEMTMMIMEMMMMMTVMMTEMMMMTMMMEMMMTMMISLSLLARKEEITLGRKEDTILSLGMMTMIVILLYQDMAKRVVPQLL